MCHPDIFRGGPTETSSWLLLLFQSCSVTFKNYSKYFALWLHRCCPAVPGHVLFFLCCQWRPPKAEGQTDGCAHQRHFNLVAILSVFSPLFPPIFAPTFRSHPSGFYLLLVLRSHPNSPLLLPSPFVWLRFSPSVSCPIWLQVSGVIPSQSQSAFSADVCGWMQKRS